MLAEWIVALLLTIYPGLQVDIGSIEIYTLPESMHQTLIQRHMALRKSWESHSEYTSALIIDDREIIFVSEKAIEISKIMPERVGNWWLASLVRAEAQYLINLRPPLLEAVFDQEEQPYYESFLSEREIKFFEALNYERTQRGLHPLTINETLTSVARVRSQDMIDNDYFGHFSPTRSSVYVLLKEAGVHYSAAGENLAKVGDDVDASVAIVIQALMDSSSHRKNILNSRYSNVGVGVATSQSGITIFTTIFTD